MLKPIAVVSARSWMTDLALKDPHGFIEAVRMSYNLVRQSKRIVSHSIFQGYEKDLSNILGHRVTVAEVMALAWAKGID